MLAKITQYFIIIFLQNVLKGANALKARILGDEMVKNVENYIFCVLFSLSFIFFVC